jgi:hypothetical protein
MANHGPVRAGPRACPQYDPDPGASQRRVRNRAPGISAGRHKGLPLPGRVDRLPYRTQADYL